MRAQEIDKQALEALSRASKLSLRSFTVLAEVAMKAAALQINSDEESKSLGEAKIDAVLQKQVYSALVNVALEAARHDLQGSDVRAALDDKLEDDQKDVFVTAFDGARTSIREQLARSTSSMFPSIVDISWRLDYYVQNNLLETIRAPAYFISLTTQQPDGTLGKAEFSANLQELQDLLANEFCGLLRNIVIAH